jgi:multiple sugar transport system ATP-binding protein
MNLLQAQVHQGQVVLMPPEGHGSGLAMTGWRPPDGWQEGQWLTVGVRPEHLEVLPQGPVPMAVDFVERLGPHAYAHGHLQGFETRLCVEVSPDWPVRPGDSMNLGVVPGRAHLFDAQGRRLKVKM